MSFCFPCVDRFPFMHPRRVSFFAYLAAVTFCSFVIPGQGFAEDGISESMAAYAQEIDQAQSHLNEGRIDEARKQLKATAKSSRGFEFEYLLARADQADATTAPHLIEVVPKPDVETRYGVLNQQTRQVVFICRDGGLRIYDLTADAAPTKSVIHTEGAAVWTGVFSDDGKLFFSGHQNGEVLVWDAATWELLHTISLGTDWPVRELVAAPDGTAMVAESKQALELWTLVDDQPSKVAELGKRLNFGEGLAFSPQGNLIATGGMFDIVLHDGKSGKQLASMQHASYTMGLKFSPDGKLIASAPRGNVNKFLGVFDVGNKSRLFNAGPFKHYISGIAFSPDGKRIAATGCEKLLRLFDAATGEIVLSLPRQNCGSEPAFTHDGQLLGWSEPDGFHFIDLGKAIVNNAP